VAMRPATPGAVGSGFRAPGAIRAGAKAPPRIRSCVAKRSRRPPASVARNMSVRVSKSARFGLVGGRRSGRSSTGGDFRSAKGASRSRRRTRRCMIIVQSSEAAAGRPAGEGVGGQPPCARVVARKGPRRPRPLTPSAPEGPAIPPLRPGISLPSPAVNRSSPSSPERPYIPGRTTRGEGTDPFPVLAVHGWRSGAGSAPPPCGPARRAGVTGTGTGRAHVRGRDRTECPAAQVHEDGRSTGRWPAESFANRPEARWSWQAGGVRRRRLRAAPP
jgi:hypothetical protein